MKATYLCLSLLLALPLFAADEPATSVNSTAVQKEPQYLDCFPDKVVIYPGSITITWQELQQTNNAVEKLLDQIQANSTNQSLVMLVRPKSVKFFRFVRRMVGERTIDLSYDAVDTDFPLPASGSIDVRPSRPSWTGGNSDKQPIFFECRNNKLFYIDKEGLGNQVGQVMSKIKRGDSIDSARTILAGAEIGDKFYKLDSSYLWTMVMALEPRPGVQGETEEELAKPDSQFQAQLAKLTQDQQRVIFLVRDDSFHVFRRARVLADQQGLDVRWEPLDATELLKFGIP